MKVGIQVDEEGARVAPLGALRQRVEIEPTPMPPRCLRHPGGGHGELVRCHTGGGITWSGSRKCPQRSGPYSFTGSSLMRTSDVLDVLYNLNAISLLYSPRVLSYLLKALAFRHSSCCSLPVTLPLPSEERSPPPFGRSILAASSSFALKLLQECNLSRREINDNSHL